MLNLGGDILTIPVSDIINDKAMAWYSQTKHSGDDAKMTALAKLGFDRYRAVAPIRCEFPFYPKDPIKRKYWQWKVRCKLQHWGII